MSQFLSTLDVRMLPEMDDQGWMLISPLVYQSDVAKMTITVPVNFITDFVSFDPLKGIGQRPSVIHDFLYSVKEFDRDLADEVLREGLLLVGVDDKLAEAMFLAVRAFGGGHKANIYNLKGEVVG